MFLPTSSIGALLLNSLSFLGWGTGLVALKEIKCSPAIYHLDFIIFRFLFSLILCILFGSDLFQSEEENWISNLGNITNAEPSVIFQRIGGPVLSGFTDMLFQIFMFIGIYCAGLSNSVPLQSGFTTIFGILLTYLVDHRGIVYIMIPGVLFNILAIFFDTRAYTELEKQNHVSLLPPLASSSSVSLVESSTPLNASLIQVEGEEHKINDETNQMEHKSEHNHEDANKILENLEKHNIDKNKSHNVATISPRALVIYCVLGAICGTFWGPGTATGGQQPNALSPYGIIFVTTLASVITAFPFSIIYMHKGIGCPPVTFKQYLTTSISLRFPAIWSSFLWSLGTWGYMVSADKLGFATSFALGQAQSFITSLWSLIIYKEFKKASCKAWTYEIIMLSCYILSIIILCFAF
ncbi:hypothetical protein WA158_005926 [Blastocystis sp. Blastoise]